MLCYLVAYVDRSNIAVAALSMNQDLGLTAAMYGLGAGLFYVTYILCEVPSNLALAKFGAKRWIARIMISWGLIASCVSLIHSANQLYGVRLLLGAAEAGFTPGIIYYLSCWYPKRERGRALSFFYIGATLASVIGMPMSGLLLGMNGFLDFAGWRWMFLLEGIPAVVLGFVVLAYLPDSPKQARWLGAKEATWLTDTIAAENATLPLKHDHHWAKALANPKVLLLALFWLLQAFGTIGVTLFMPLIVKGLSGQNNLAVSLLSALPFLLACILMYWNGHHSDKSGERALHLGLPLAAAGVLMAAAVFAAQGGMLLPAYVLLVAAVGLNWASTPVFWAVTTEHVSGVAAAASIALINATANIAGLALPPLIGRIKDVTNSYDYGVLMIAAALVFGGLLGLRLAPPRNDGQAAAAKDHVVVNS
jgi:MFS family permease